MQAKWCFVTPQVIKGDAASAPFTEYSALKPSATNHISSPSTLEPSCCKNAQTNWNGESLRLPERELLQAPCPSTCKLPQQVYYKFPSQTAQLSFSEILDSQKPWGNNNCCCFKPLPFEVISYMAIGKWNTTIPCHHCFLALSQSISSTLCYHF